MSTFATRTARNESIWRERLARQAASGKTIAVFCHEEGVGKSTLSYWRRRLGVVDEGGGQELAAVAAPFLDVGRVKAARWRQHSASPADSASELSSASIELRLELGNGVVLHIARH
jgi:transposase-like protein